MFSGWRRNNGSDIQFGGDSTSHSVDGQNLEVSFVGMFLCSVLVPEQCTWIFQLGE